MLIYREYLGIATGDIVRTSYHTGPYRVAHIWEPHYWDLVTCGVLVIRTWPVISLNGALCRGGRPDFIINDIRQEGERWFSDSNDEIFVEKSCQRAPTQMPLFQAEGPWPYPFAAGIDYELDGRVWKCEICGDFNAERPKDHRWWNPDCPRCGRYADYQLMLMPPRDAGVRQLNAYVMALNRA